MAALTYDSFGLLKQALSDAGGPGRQAVRDALARTRGYEGVTGIMQFDKDSEDPTKSASIIQLKEGSLSGLETAGPEPETKPELSQPAGIRQPKNGQKILFGQILFLAATTIRERQVSRSRATLLITLWEIEGKFFNFVSVS